MTTSMAGLVKPERIAASPMIKAPNTLNVGPTDVGNRMSRPLAT